jgi:hypothetical protein
MLVSVRTGLCTLGWLVAVGCPDLYADDPPGRAKDKCICKEMRIYGSDLPNEKQALGPTGDGKTPWTLNADLDDDGKTLGPAKDNPDNKGNPKPRIGYSFEVVVRIEGNPRKCAEIQLAKASGEFKGFKQKDCEKGGGAWINNACKYTYTWSGVQGNLDKAGKPALSVGNAADCKKQGGEWDGTKCKIQFPFSGADHGPDNASEDGKGYEKGGPGTLKRYLDQGPRCKIWPQDNCIIWKDRVASNAPGVGSWLKASIIPVIQGTDGKFCFARFETDLERTKNGAREELNMKIKPKADATAKDIP